VSSPLDIQLQDGEELADGEADGVPAVASARRYLRDALPSIYRTRGSFTMRFLYALERVLDARLAIVESLGAYLQPRLAPLAMVDAMADWLGLELGNSPAGIPHRELLAHSEQVARKRGTRAGLELALGVAFPDLDLRVDDRGGVVVVNGGATPAPQPYPGFFVHCPGPLTPSRRAAVEWAIARQLPLGVEYRLLDASPSPEPAR